MIRVALPAFVVLTLFVSPSFADRVPSQKAPAVRNHGARPDIFIPYTTNGRGNLGVYQGVGPLIYSSPGVGDPGQKGDADAQQKPVANLIFYGSTLKSSTTFNGPQQRRPNQLRPNK